MFDYFIGHLLNELKIAKNWASAIILATMLKRMMEGFLLCYPSYFLLQSFKVKTLTELYLEKVLIPFAMKKFSSEFEAI